MRFAEQRHFFHNLDSLTRHFQFSSTSSRADPNPERQTVHGQLLNQSVYEAGLPLRKTSNRSSSGTCDSLILFFASSMRKNWARSTSGNSWSFPEPRGHSIGKVLLRNGRLSSQSCSTAQA